jgi:hypothetical protein
MPDFLWHAYQGKRTLLTPYPIAFSNWALYSSA